MKKKRYPLVLIEWEDSALARAEWHYEDDLDAIRTTKCVSVGFLIKSTKKEKLLAANLGAIGKDCQQLSGIVAIPVSCITKQKKLTSSSAYDLGAA